MPSVAIDIGGRRFEMDKRDMIVPELKVGDRCATSFTRGFEFDDFPDGFYVLGDAFLYNVVAVFDKGKEQMHFASHVGY